MDDYPALLAPIDVKLTPEPVRQAICQVRHNNLPGNPLGYAAQVMAELGWTVIEPQDTQELLVVATEHGIQPSGKSQSGAVLKRDAFSIALYPDSFTLDTTDYTRWDDFMGVFKALLAAVIKHGNPLVRTRIGVRFMDQLVHVEGISRSARVDNALGGLMAHPRLGARLTGALSIAQMREGPYTIVLRHGFEPDKPDLYTIDTDCAKQGGEPFASSTIIEDAEALHSLCSSIFRDCLSDDYYAAISGGREREVRDA